MTGAADGAGEGLGEGLDVGSAFTSVKQPTKPSTKSRRRSIPGAVRDPGTEDLEAPPAALEIQLTTGSALAQRLTVELPQDTREDRGI